MKWILQTKMGYCILLLSVCILFLCTSGSGLNFFDKMFQINSQWSLGLWCFHFISFWTMRYVLAVPLWTWCLEGFILKFRCSHNAQKGMRTWLVSVMLALNYTWIPSLSSPECYLEVQNQAYATVCNFLTIVALYLLGGWQKLWNPTAFSYGKLSIALNYLDK